MNRKTRKLQQYKTYLNKCIKAIKKRENGLMLRAILLSSQREFLELKLKEIEGLIEEQQTCVSKQTIRTNYNNSYCVLFLN